MKSVRATERRKLPEPPGRNPVTEVKNLHDSDEEVELHYPSTSQDEVTYPSFTVMHDIPEQRLRLP